MGYFRIFGCSFLLIVTFSVVLINDYLYSDRYGFLDIAITNILYPRNESLQIDVRHGNQHEQIMYVGIRNYCFISRCETITRCRIECQIKYN